MYTLLTADELETLDMEMALEAGETAAKIARDVRDDDEPGDDAITELRAPLAAGSRGRFAFAGRAVLTVRNPSTGNRFTYRVAKSPDNGDGRAPVWFVSVLTGTDSQFSYLGTVFAGGRFRVTAKSRIAADAPSALAFAWLVEHIESARVEVWHEGRCGKCGRALTVPESIASGLGPVCAAGA